ncbi:MAG: PAS domain S-box protein [Nitrospirae bacterium]|nr:PAS domain S-box protein [Nitrospirota bacterium]
MVRILNLEAIKNTILYLSRKRIELSLIIFIPAFLALFAFGSAYIVQDIIFTSLNKNIISISEATSARGNVNIVLLVSTLTAIITGLILAYSILLPIKRILKSLAVSHQPSADREVIPDNILGRDFSLMVTSLNKYVDILESMSGGIITVNSSGIVTTVNPSAEIILGYSSTELIGRAIEEVGGELKGGEGGLSDFKKIVYDSLRDKRVYSSEEINIVTKDNRHISLGATTSLLKDRDGVLTGIVVNFKDLSRIKEIHNQLQRADRLAGIGSIAAGVAHEIRNPLGAIKGLAQLLSEEFKGSERVKYINTIISEVDRLNVVVENLLNLANPGRAQQKLCDINETIHNAVNLSRYYIIEKDIQIFEKYDESLPEVAAEGERLYQAFINILMNAIEAIDKQGRIWISTKLKDISILIDFSNSNSYISPEDIKHIFDPFYTTKDKGSGLGLAITHQIINASKGTISVESDNEGTHFYVTLPVTPQPNLLPVCPVSADRQGQAGP